MNQRTSTQTRQRPNNSFHLMSGVLQRKCAACGNHTFASDECPEYAKKKDFLQRQSASKEGANEVPHIVHEALNSPGEPLDLWTRATMEPYFGHSFSNVRVHADKKAADSAKAVNALAYTTGNHIVFGAGHYSPRSGTGAKLLAHELTHVVQQQSGRLGDQRGVGSDGNVHEREADVFADYVFRRFPEMKSSVSDSSATIGTPGTRISEDEDTQMSVEPLNPRFLYQNGTTTCTFPAGTPSTTILNGDCARPCTVRHEAVHFADISPCCAKAGTAHAAAATPAAKQTVEDQFFAWMSGNRSWFECRAYATSVTCADELLTNKNCAAAPAPADAACCATLSSYRADKETRRASNCAAAGAALTACPFP